MRKIEVSQFRLSEYKEWVATNAPHKSASKQKAFELFRDNAKNVSSEGISVVRVLREVQDTEVKNPIFEYVRIPGMEKVKQPEPVSQGKNQTSRKSDRKFAVRFPVFFTDARLTFIQALQRAGEEAKANPIVSTAIKALADGIYAQKEFDEAVFGAVWNLSAFIIPKMKDEKGLVLPELEKAHKTYTSALSLMDVCHHFGKADFGEVTAFVRRLEANKKPPQAQQEPRPAA